jgi:chromosome segregation ATPase
VIIEERNRLIDDQIKVLRDRDAEIKDFRAEIKVLRDRDAEIKDFRAEIKVLRDRDAENKDEIKVLRDRIQELEIELEGHNCTFSVSSQPFLRLT